MPRCRIKFVTLLCITSNAGTCPNDCSGHGVCSTIGDVALYDGPDYDSTMTFAGDGLGPAYTNWDKNSIQLCECEQGFFGADCSLGTAATFVCFSCYRQSAD